MNGKYHGQGSLTFKNGRKYVGEWVNGKKHGHGSYSGWDESYVGDWANDERHGQGTAIFHKNGGQYVGQWAHDLMHGQGTMTGPDGWEYTGDWDSGWPGQGTWTFRGIPVNEDEPWLPPIPWWADLEYYRSY